MGSEIFHYPLVSRSFRKQQITKKKRARIVSRPVKLSQPTTIFQFSDGRFLKKTFIFWDTWYASL